MTIVKICGLTNLDDALLAPEAGADLPGLVLYRRSTRRVALSVVAGITQAPQSGRRIFAGPTCPPDSLRI